MNELHSIPLSQLHVSHTGAQSERRKHLDKGALTELAASIRELGVLQPIIVTSVGNGIAKYAIVAGERRFLAAKEAGLAEIPAMVRTLSDQQILEVQLIENLQRQDLHELAEAEGYEQLQKHGYAAEEMAAKVGKSKATVYARMKLLALTPKSRKAFYDGKLSASTALLLARIPVSALQEQALKEITVQRESAGSPWIERYYVEGIADYFRMPSNALEALRANP